MRITKRTSIAMRLLMYCALHDRRLVTKAEVAEACAVSGNHLAQVINQLARLGYLDTQRGRNGGLRLAQRPEQIRIGQVFRDVEGEVPSEGCFADADCSCRIVAACGLRTMLADAANAFYRHLDGFTLDSLLADNGALKALLQPVRNVA